MVAVPISSSGSVTATKLILLCIYPYFKHYQGRATIYIYIYSLCWMKNISRYIFLVRVVYCYARWRHVTLNNFYNQHISF